MEDISTSDLKRVFTVVGGIVALAFFAVFLYNALEDVGPPEPLTVTVTLVNDCGVPDEVFMAKAMPNGPTATFAGGKATLKAMSNQRIKIVANAALKDFNFEGPEADAAPQLKLTANCESSQRFDTTREAMRDAFGKK
jgi:hypothetical protein